MNSDGGELLKILACSVTDRAKEGKDASGEDDDDDESGGGVETEDENTKKRGK